MKQELFKDGIAAAKRKRKGQWVLFFGILTAAAAVNLGLCLGYDDRFDALFTVLNIVVDIAALWFAAVYYALFLSVQGKLLSLAGRMPYGAKETGTLLEVSEKTRRIRGLDCKEAVFLHGKEEFAMFLVCGGNIVLREGASYRLTAVDNIIVEAEEIEK